MFVQISVGIKAGNATRSLQLMRQDGAKGHLSHMCKHAPVITRTLARTRKDTHPRARMQVRTCTRRHKLACADARGHEYALAYEYARTTCARPFETSAV